MRWLINYIRSCFCKHEWDKGYICSHYNCETDNMPEYHIIVYICKKCKYVKKVKV